MLKQNFKTWLNYLEKNNITHDLKEKHFSTSTIKRVQEKQQCFCRPPTQPYGQLGYSDFSL